MTEQAIMPNQTSDETQDNGDWRSEYLADNPGLMNDPILQDIPDVATLAKMAIDERRINGSMSKLPTEKSTPEELDKFFNKLGRPEKIDGYKIDKSLLPEGMSLNEARIKAFLPVAHKLRLTNSQVQELIKYTGVEQEQAAKVNATKREADVEALRQEWGTNFDKEVAITQKAVGKFATEEERQYLTSKGLDNDPTLVKMFNRVGKGMLEDVGTFGRGAGFSSVEGTKEEITKIMNDDNHPYHKGDKAAVAKMHELFKIAYPGERK